MPNATFGVSSIGVLIVLDEGFTRTPPLRLVYMALAIFYCLLINAKLLHYYQALLQKSMARSSTAFGMMLCFITSNFVHTMHIVDHMYRPVDYHEAYWIYRKYLVTEVELGHYTTLVTSMVGLFGIQRALAGVQTKIGGLIRTSTLALIFYMIFGCVGGLIHYAAETPGYYGIMANFTISGAGIICIPFTVLIVYDWIRTPTYTTATRTRTIHVI